MATKKLALDRAILWQIYNYFQSWEAASLREWTHEEFHPHIFPSLPWIPGFFVQNQNDGPQLLLLDMSSLRSPRVHHNLGSCSASASPPSLIPVSNYIFVQLYWIGDSEGVQMGFGQRVEYEWRLSKSLGQAVAWMTQRKPKRKMDSSPLFILCVCFFSPLSATSQLIYLTSKKRTNVCEEALHYLKPRHTPFHHFIYPL